MAWKPKYVLIIILLTAIDYLAALWIEQAQTPRRRRLFWLFSLLANLGMLFVFKYLGFFTQEFNSLMTLIEAPLRVSVVDLILPIGISFHTFQAVSYTTDVYLGRQKAEKSPIQFALFIAWFPQMVAGPIERGSTLLPQLSHFSVPTAEGFRSSLWLILWGFFKKTVVADNLANISDPFFQNPQPFATGYAWLATYAFAFQIYCDFSAYTDIAKGSSQLFGVRLRDNFNNPYLSRSLPEFWKRWHMSLSSWFFEYVYYPFVRSSSLRSAPFIGIILVFFLSGLWHGANWTFVIWGLANGLIYIMYMLLNRIFTIPDNVWARVAMIVINFHLVCFCWIFFRSPNIGIAADVFRKIVQIPSSGDLTHLQPTEFFGVIGLAIMAAFFNIHAKTRQMSWFKFSLISIVVIVLILVMAVPSGQTFLYFQF